MKDAKSNPNFNFQVPPTLANPPTRPGFFSTTVPNDLLASLPPLLLDDNVLSTGGGVENKVTETNAAGRGQGN